MQGVRVYVCLCISSTQTTTGYVHLIHICIKAGFSFLKSVFLFFRPSKGFMHQITKLCLGS